MEDLPLPEQLHLLFVTVESMSLQWRRRVIEGLNIHFKCRECQRSFPRLEDFVIHREVSCSEQSTIIQLGDKTQSTEIGHQTSMDTSPSIIENTPDISSGPSPRVPSTRKSIETEKLSGRRSTIRSPRLQVHHQSDKVTPKTAVRATETAALRRSKRLKKTILAATRTPSEVLGRTRGRPSKSICSALEVKPHITPEFNEALLEIGPSVLESAHKLDASNSCSEHPLKVSTPAIDGDTSGMIGEGLTQRFLELGLSPIAQKSSSHSTDTIMSRQLSNATTAIKILTSGQSQPSESTSKRKFKKLMILHPATSSKRGGKPNTRVPSTRKSIETEKLSGRRSTIRSPRLQVHHQSDKVTPKTAVRATETAALRRSKRLKKTILAATRTPSEVLGRTRGRPSKSS